jgi:GT2 family glycosyltransferase
MHDSSPAPAVSVVIVSKGRPSILAETLQSLARQTMKPERIVLVVPSAEDLPEHFWNDNVQTVVGPLGASVQRNEGIAVIPLSVRYVAFFDDDMELREDYLASAVAFLEANATVVGLSGHVLGNGNVTREEGRARIDAYQPKRDFQAKFQSEGSGHTLHGCNMVIRRGVLEYEKFDEELPLYSYNEDYDLSLRLEEYGRIGRFIGCISVHLETPSGRVREDMRGYSLVANNYYFLKHKSTHLPAPLAWVRFWIVCVARPLLICLAHLAKGDTSQDFRARLKGILIAVKDIFTGKSHPGRIREF